MRNPRRTLEPVEVGYDPRADAEACRRRNRERVLAGVRFLGESAASMAYFVGFMGVTTFAFKSSAYGIAAIMVIAVLGRLVGIALADPLARRRGPKMVVLAGLILMALVLFAYQFVPQTIFWLGAMAFGWGICFGAADGALSLWVLSVREDEGSDLAKGAFGFATAAGDVAGPLTGALVAMALPAKSVFLGSAVLGVAAASVAVLAKGGMAPLAALDDGEGPVDQVSEGFHVCLGSARLRLLMVAGWGSYFVLSAFDSLEALFVRNSLQLDIVWLGWLACCAALGLVAGALAASHLPKGSLGLRSGMLSLAIVGAGMLVFVVTRNGTVALLGQVLLGFGYGAQLPAQDELVEALAPPALGPGLRSSLRLGARAASIVPIFAAPFLASLFSVRQVLAGCGLAALVLGMVLVLAVPRSMEANRAPVEF